MSDISLKLTYGSLGHILSIIVPIFLIIILFYILRYTSSKTQRTVILFIMLINVIQHVFKAWVWYPIWHGKFNVGESFFCNICGCLIILSPLIFLSKKKGLKDALFILGNLSSIVSTWFITISYGLEFTSIVYIRYFTAHCLLMITSTLPVLLGLHTLNIKNCWVAGLFYIALETLVFLNDLTYVAWKNSWDWVYSYKVFYNTNSLFIAHAANVHVFDHTFMEGTHIPFVIDDGTYKYTPILWSAPVIFAWLCPFSALVIWLCGKIHIDDYYLAWREEKMDN